MSEVDASHLKVVGPEKQPGAKREADGSGDPLADYADHLAYRMKLTEGARYQAARRHQRRATASVWATIFLSMYVFSASTYVTLYSDTASTHVIRLISMMSIIMSAFIIAFSVLEQGKKHDLKSELFLRCAQGIQILKDKIDIELKAKSITLESIKDYSQKYNELVHDFSDNHSEADYRTFRINIGKHKGERLYIFSNRFLYWIDCWAIMLVAMFVPPIAMAVIMIYLDQPTPPGSAG